MLYKTHGGGVEKSEGTLDSGDKLAWDSLMPGRCGRILSYYDLAMRLLSYIRYTDNQSGPSPAENQAKSFPLSIVSTTSPVPRFPRLKLISASSSSLSLSDLKEPQSPNFICLKAHLHVKSRGAFVSAWCSIPPIDRLYQTVSIIRI